jgi:hypothetical protein
MAKTTEQTIIYTMRTWRAPPKIGKNKIFWRNFSHEISQKCSRLPPLGAIFLSAPPLA